MSTNNLLKIQEVAVMIGSSVQTISMWYKFKKENPENEYAKMLPEYKTIGNLKTRYWNRDDIWKLIEFKINIPHGRYGVFGSVTQRYVKDSKWNKEGK